MSLPERLGPYRVVGLLGRGGMAEVLHAQAFGASGFVEDVALKVLLPELRGNASLEKLLLEEARLGAQLHHPCLVAVHDLGVDDGVYYVRMELVDGADLSTLTLGEPIEVALALHLAEQVALALAYVHARTNARGLPLGLVHRDVSPQNVLVARHGHVKLGDFGIAKAKSMNDPAQRRRLMLGKKHYMSPEQMLAEETTWRSDVFSMGVVLFELLALRFLFEEDDTDLAVDEVTKAPMPAIKDLLPDASPGLARILDMSIARDPQERPTAAAMGRELDAWCHSQREPGSPERLQAHLQMLFAHAYQPRSGILRG